MMTFARALCGRRVVLPVPVIFMQIEMRDLARKVRLNQNLELPPRLFRTFPPCWFRFGIPGFGSVMAISLADDRPNRF